MGKGTDWITKHQVVTPVITAGPYTAADVVGGPMVFDFNFVGGGLYIRRAWVVDSSNQKAGFNLWFFKAAPNTLLDNAPIAGLTTPSLLSMIGTLQIPAANYRTFTDRAIAFSDDVNIGADYLAEGKVYAYAECLTGPTYPAINSLTFVVEGYCQFAAWKS